VRGEMLSHARMLPRRAGISTGIPSLTSYGHEGGVRIPVLIGLRARTFPAGV